MATPRTLLLLRHAETEDTRPGGRDLDRRLTGGGRGAGAGRRAFLADQGLTVDAVLCSSAVRTRQTLDGLGLALAGLPRGLDISSDYYNAGADTLIEALREPGRGTAAPRCWSGMRRACRPSRTSWPTRTTSDPAALAAIDGRFPAATLARLEFDGDWADLETAALVDVRLP